MSRKKPSSLPIAVSVSMVLFLLGLMGSVLIYSSRLIDHFKQEVVVMVYFKKQVSEAQLDSSVQKIAALPFVRKHVYVSSEEAAYSFRDELGENFTEILGDNPLPASVQVYLNLNIIKDRKKVELAVQNLGRVSLVQEVDYEKNLVEDMNRNSRVVAIALGTLALLLVLVSVLLINNTVRLAVYSRRFLIRSMQLVGAKEWFILRPFLLRSLLVAFLGTLVAFVFTASAVWALRQLGQYFYGSMVPDLPGIGGISDYSLLFVALFTAGLLVVLPTTYYSTKKYLHMKIDDLY